MYLFNIQNTALVKTSQSLRSALILSVWAFLVFSLNAQDIHFSQFANSPMNLSPGLAGVFGGDMRFVGNYRNQWRTVPVPYTTFSGTVENKFYHRPGRFNRFFTGGLMINYDRQGSLHLSSLQIGIPISYTTRVGANNYLTFGVTPAFGQRSFNTNKITFDEQFIDCFYVPGSPITENLASTNLKYFDLSAGLNFRTQARGTRSKLDVGAGLHHINRPYHDFWSSDLENPGNVRLADRLALYGLGLVQIFPKVDLIAQGTYQRQGGFREILYGAAGRFHLNVQPYQELALQVGLDYRSRYNDALIPHVEVLWRTWTLGFTYDINLSGFDAATNRRGGPEVALIYRLYRVKPLPFFKSCPII